MPEATLKEVTPADALNACWEKFSQHAQQVLEPMVGTFHLKLDIPEMHEARLILFTSVGRAFHIQPRLQVRLWPKEGIARPERFVLAWVKNDEGEYVARVIEGGKLLSLSTAVELVRSAEVASI